MAAPAAKDCHGCTTYFVKVFKNKYGFEPNINRHAARWGFDSVLRGMDYTQAKGLIDYYFTTQSNNQHDITWFFYNYDKIVTSMQDAEIDQNRIDDLLEESQKRAEEWRKRGASRTIDN